MSRAPSRRDHGSEESRAHRKRVGCCGPFPGFWENMIGVAWKRGA